jgi:pimeloyl-ACP methyl ester carboxylesterase
VTAATVRASDGVLIALEDAGRREGPPVVLVHGLAQSRDVWRTVLEGPLAAEYRLVAVDLRGHGDSDVPRDEGAYVSERLGDDLHAVIASLDLSRPVVVAWSYGGVVAGAYLRRHGSSALGGLLLAAAAVQVGKPARGLFGPVMMSNARALMSVDVGEYEAGARSFLRGCSAAPLEARAFERAASAMLRVPAHVRRALLARSEDYLPELARCAAPIATLHGALDAVVLPRMSELVASSVPVAESTVLDGVGHVTWLEAPGAFIAAARAIGALARVRRAAQGVEIPSSPEQAHDTSRRASS